jgi:hypothetical protein
LRFLFSVVINTIDVDNNEIKEEEEEYVLSDEIRLIVMPPND